MSASLKNPFKNTKLKAFFVFLFLASVFWVLTKFSKQDVAFVVATISYTNIPEGTILSKENPKEVSFNLAATRFEFLNYAIKKPEVTIDVATFQNEGSQQITIDAAALEKLILNQVVSDGRITQVSLSEIKIKLERLNVKKVPVRPNVSIAYDIGFDALGKMILKPDSVTVTGAKQVLDTIDFVETASIVMKDISEAITQNVAIQDWQDNALTVSPAMIEVHQNVAEYSQKIVIVPITMINQPLEGSFKLLPATVKVAFNVPIERFKDVSASDFKIVCDYRSRNQEDNFMIPVIKEQPDHITGIEMETKKIDLLFFK